MSTLPLPADARVWRLVRLNLLVGLAMFVVNSVIGTLNSVDVGAEDYSRGLQLMHVHAGTIGWLTLTAMSAMFWMLTTEQAPSEALFRRIRITSIISWFVFPLYSLSFLIAFEWGNDVTVLWWLLPLFGLLSLGMIGHASDLGRTLLKETGSRDPAVIMVVVGLSVAALASLVGIILGIQAAGRWNFGFEEGIGAHAGTMTTFVGLVTLGVVEWVLRKGDALPWDGKAKAMVGLLGVGALLNAVLMLFVPPEIGGMVGLLGVIGLILWFVRMGGTWAPQWPKDGSAASWMWFGPLFFTVSLVFVMLGGPLEKAHFFVAGGHAEYVLAMTMAFAGLVVAATGPAQGAWAKVELGGMWLTVIGGVGFIAAVATEGMTHMGAIMGIGVWMIIAALGHRVWASLQADEGAGAVAAAPAADDAADDDGASDEADGEADAEAVEDGEADEAADDGADEAEDDDAEEDEEADEGEDDEPEEAAADEADDSSEAETEDAAHEGDEAHTDASLMAMLKAELVALAEAEGLDASGTKQDLTDRILAAQS